MPAPGAQFQSACAHWQCSVQARGSQPWLLFHALERCTASERKQIETVLQERAFDGVTHAEILEILEKYGSLEAVRSSTSSVIWNAIPRSWPYCAKLS